MGVTYRGRHSDAFGLAVQTNPHILPNFKNSAISIPGMDGSHYSSTEYEERIIPLTIGFLENEPEDYESRLRTLANWLRPDSGVGIYASDNEPDKYYYAILDSTDISRVEGIARMGKGTINLICHDPYAYGYEQTQQLSGNTAITNGGTAGTYPIFDLTVNQDTSIIELTNLSNLTKAGTARSIKLGQPKPIDQAPVYTRTLVLQDTMSATSGWTGASEVDSGYVSGSFGVAPDGFFVDKWGDEDGTGTSDSWIGPSLQKALSAPLNSFQADIFIENWNDDGGGAQVSPEGVGIIEVYMRDANGQSVCKIQFGDSFDNANENQGLFAAGGKRYPAIPDYPTGWNDFDGVLRIKRDSNFFYPYFAQIIDGKHGSRERMGGIIPGSVISTNDVTDIQITMRKWYGARPMYQRIKEIKIYDFVGMYEYPDTTAKIEFKTGDNLHIDVAKGLVLLNGEIRTDVVGLGTEFWSLVEGANDVQPSNSVTGTVSYRERYL